MNGALTVGCNTVVHSTIAWVQSLDLSPAGDHERLRAPPHLDRDILVITRQEDGLALNIVKLPRYSRCRIPPGLTVKCKISPNRSVGVVGWGDDHGGLLARAPVGHGELGHSWRSLASHRFLIQMTRGVIRYAVTSTDGFAFSAHTDRLLCLLLVLAVQIVPTGSVLLVAPVVAHLPLPSGAHLAAPAPVWHHARLALVQGLALHTVTGGAGIQVCVIL